LEKNVFCNPETDRERKGGRETDREYKYKDKQKEREILKDKETGSREKEEETVKIPFHNGADIDASIASHVALSHDTDTQKTGTICHQQHTLGSIHIHTMQLMYHIVYRGQTGKTSYLQLFIAKHPNWKQQFFKMCISLQNEL